MKRLYFLTTTCAALTSGFLVSANTADAEISYDQASITSEELQRRLVLCLSAEEWLRSACLDVLADLSLVSEPQDEPETEAVADGVELHMIGIYEARQRRSANGEVRRGEVPVTVDRPGQTVVLVLTSYEAVKWNVGATRGTRIAQVIIGGNKRNRSEVLLDGIVIEPEWNDDIGFSYKDEGPRFQTLTEVAVAAADVKNAASFQGDYAAPVEGYTIAAAPGVLNPREFIDQIFEKARPRRALPANMQAALKGEVPNAAANWRFDETGFSGVDATGAAVSYAMPADLPRASRAGGVAFDVEGQRLWAATYSGEGFLYEYDIARNRWSAKSMEQKDAAGLIYDPAAKRLIGTPGTLPNSPYFIFTDQALLTTTLSISLRDYPGLTQYFDSGNGPSPSMTPLAVSGDLVLVRPDFGHMRFGQTIPPLLYLVNIGTGTVELVGQ